LWPVRMDCRVKPGNDDTVNSSSVLKREKVSA
jgi:hypothetical protein